VADLFSAHATETDWEWAAKRRTLFKTPKVGVFTGIGTFVFGMLVRGSFAEPSWFRASLFPALTAVLVAIVLPQVETWWIWRKRHRIRLEELMERPAPSPTVTPAIAAPPDRPKAEVTFDCDQTGWARLRVRNTGAGADLAATIQLYGLTAGVVEGKQMYAQWELGDEAKQWLAAGETRTLRLASIWQIMPGLRAWAVHRTGGDDIRGVNLVEFMDVRLVAVPDLVAPCELQVLLNADGDSRMARAGVDPPLFHIVPPRVADMRQLLVEAADYIRAIPYGLGNAKAAIYMSVMVKFHIAEFIEQAFGAAEAKAYSDRFTDDLHPTRWQETSAGLLLGLGQRATEANILQSFELPITWSEFYERQPEWEWPEYD
jgi:hypothetical protein